MWHRKLIFTTNIRREKKTKSTLFSSQIHDSWNRRDSYENAFNPDSKPMSRGADDAFVWCSLFSSQPPGNCIVLWTSHSHTRLAMDSLPQRKKQRKCNRDDEQNSSWISFEIFNGNYAIARVWYIYLRLIYTKHCTRCVHSRLFENAIYT